MHPSNHPYGVVTHKGYPPDVRLRGLDQADSDLNLIGPSLFGRKSLIGQLVAIKGEQSLLIYRSLGALHPKDTKWRTNKRPNLRQSLTMLNVKSAIIEDKSHMRNRRPLGS